MDKRPQPRWLQHLKAILGIRTRGSDKSLRTARHHLDPDGPDYIKVDPAENKRYHCGMDEDWDWDFEGAEGLDEHADG
jgi:hypothetical protein